MAVDPVQLSQGLRVTPTDSSVLQRLADGATLEARVLTKLPDGVARLRIAGAVIEAKVPPSLTSGSTVTVTVSKSADGVRLLLALPNTTAATAPAQQGSPPRPPLATPEAVRPPASGPSASPAPRGLATSGAGPVYPTSPGATSTPSPVATTPASLATPTSMASPSPMSSPVPGPLPPSLAAPPTPAQSNAPGQTTPLNSPSSASPGAAQAGLPSSAPNLAASGPDGLPSKANSSAPATPATNATAAPAGVTSSAPETRAILNETVHRALARQDDVAPVLSLAAQAMASPAVAAKLPVEAQRLVQMLLNLKVEVPKDGQRAGKAALGPDTIKAAVAASGVFLEQTLAKGASGAPGGDMKAILMALVALGGKDGTSGEKPGSAPAPDRSPPPARRDEPDARGAGRTVTLDAPQALRQLAETADAALERIRLMQYASLDSAVEGAPVRQDTQPAPVREARFDLPFQIGREVHVIPFRVSRETPERRQGEAPPEPIWKLAFAICVEPIGPVHARLRLVGDRLDVRLFAERADVAERMADKSGELRQALGGEGLIDLDGVSVEAGRPGQTPRGVERHA